LSPSLSKKIILSLWNPRVHYRADKYMSIFPSFLTLFIELGTTWQGNTLFHPREFMNQDNYCFTNKFCTDSVTYSFTSQPQLVKFSDNYEQFW